MHLSRKTLGNIPADKIDIPSEANFQLPEKLIQFGTGVLLRGLPDYFVDKANKQGIFNGRVVIIKSTSSGDTDSFSRQDNLYTLCVRGFEQGETMEENIINGSISRVLSAGLHWKEVLSLAESPDIEILISNTTEIGIALSQEIITDTAPESFPGKLLAFLYHRYRAFKAAPEKGLVIVPTELIPDNGKVLLDIVLQMAAINRYEPAFIRWVREHNDFCSSLVDRIVPGKWGADKAREECTKLGYEDDLMIVAESYHLWAIESGSSEVKKKLSFCQADEGVVIAPDIRKFRELKLRLLNGSHTYCCGIAFLAGFKTVNLAMQDPSFSTFIKRLIWEEIIPALLDKEISQKEAEDFAGRVLDRFRNPYIEHSWYNITLQYSSKMRMRNLNLLLNYFGRRSAVPKLMATGWAAHLLFMKCQLGADNSYYGTINGTQYLIQDSQAMLYSKAWQHPERVVQDILGNKTLWGTDLSALPEFEKSVNHSLQIWIKEGFDGVMNYLQIR